MWASVINVLSNADGRFLTPVPLKIRAADTRLVERCVSGGLSQLMDLES